MCAAFAHAQTRSVCLRMLLARAYYSNAHGSLWAHAVHKCTHLHATVAHIVRLSGHPRPFCVEQLQCMQINCDGEPMRATHFSFKVLPQRLRLHMPQPKLLRQPSRVLNTAQLEYHSKMKSQLERPARKPRQTLLRHPVFQSLLTNGLVLGMGVALTLGVQRFQQRIRSDA